ncbi:MAG: VTT domain-containing protein [Mariprofundales bacterium]
MDWPLFFSALLSSTLLPGGSEAMFLLRLHQGGDAEALLMIATIGNVLGSLITFAIGWAGNRYLRHHTIGRWFLPNSARLAQAERLFTRLGQPALLFAWLPLIGDPLCLLAGLLHLDWRRFLLLISLGKLARYAALILFI